ncbi:Stp1/IreP family PP2C-type Ser/Thr phosphatase [Sorangium sp. So ce233]
MSAHRPAVRQSVPASKLGGSAVQPHLVLEAAGISHPGMVRDTNEDSFAILESRGLFLVADGMGGRAAGEVASRMAIDTVRDFFNDPESTWPVAVSVGPATVRGSEARYVDQGLPLLVAGIQLANGRIFSAARRDREKRGMGTTFVAVLARDGFVAIAHVGDSRVYRLRDQRLEQLTRDHSLVNECIRLGHLLPEQASSFPLQHVITRALGTDEAVEVETRIDAIEGGDVMLLCSDGLSGVVPAQDIASILGERADLSEITARLVKRANENGGPDNVTCVVVRWRASPDGQPRR